MCVCICTLCVCACVAVVNNLVIKHLSFVLVVIFGESSSLNSPNLFMCIHFSYIFCFPLCSDTNFHPSRLTCHEFHFVYRVSERNARACESEQVMQECVRVTERGQECVRKFSRISQLMYHLLGEERMKYARAKQ